MAIPFTDARVVQMTGGRLEVMSSDSAEYAKGSSGVGVTLFAPTTISNGGPQMGNFPLYNIAGTDENKEVKIEKARYLGLTPAGNAQFTTE